jgi:hypothetical protein
MMKLYNIYNINNQYFDLILEIKMKIWNNNGFHFMRCTLPVT